MESFFHIQPERGSRREIEVLTNKQRTQRSKGYQAAHANRLKAFLTLKGLRGGGFNEGMRNHAAFIYASALRGVKADKLEAHQQVQEMGQQCRPKLSPADCRRTVDGAFDPKQKTRNLRYQTIADQLLVTPDEAEIISQAIGKPFPPAVTFEPKLIVPAALSRNKEQQRRRAAIQRLLERETAPPSYRKMQRLLQKQRIEASHITIKADYAAMGVESADQTRRKQISETKSRQLVIA